MKRTLVRDHNVMKKIVNFTLANKNNKFRIQNYIKHVNITKLKYGFFNCSVKCINNLSIYSIIQGNFQ